MFASPRTACADGRDDVAALDATVVNRLTAAAARSQARDRADR